MVTSPTWSIYGVEVRAARRRLIAALVAQFDLAYGTREEDKLETLQTLCGKLSLSPVPETITACKKVPALIRRRPCREAAGPLLTRTIGGFPGRLGRPAGARKHHRLYRFAADGAARPCIQDGGAVAAVHRGHGKVLSQGRGQGEAAAEVFASRRRVERSGRARVVK